MASRVLRIVAVLSVLMAGCADDPQRQVLDHVNMRTQREVTFTGGVKWSLGQKGDCTTFALHNLQALKARGIPAAAWIVWDNLGQAHAVVVSGDMVLDNHYRHIMTRSALEKIGYRFRFPLSEDVVALLVRNLNPGVSAARTGQG